MKKSWILLTACAALLSGVEAIACTGLLVGKKASTDGSVMISYAADSHSLYGEMYRWPAATWPKGAMLEVKEWDTGKPLGKIAQVEKTYSVVGNMNEHQVAITESTFGGRHELVDTTGIMDYGSLIYIALQRSKSAREAIKVMTDLVKEYGYYSSGETFSIADKNEAWVMEMIGKGPGNKGAVWVAIRIPDDCISAHANQSRIQQIPLTIRRIACTRRMWFLSPVRKDISRERTLISVSPRLIARMISAPCVDARLVYGLSSVNMIPRWISIRILSRVILPRSRCLCM
jgi:hypothetical protein